MTTKTTTPKLITKEKYQFSVNAPYTQDRTGNYERRDKVASKWENTKESVNGCGNVANEFNFDVSKQSFVFGEWQYEDDNLIALSQMMSPALFLYRIIATFFGNPKCGDDYKIIWTYNIKHKESGKVLQLSEWKGAIGFWLPETDHTKITKAFKADIIELMNYLCSNECAHPYDNLVAGSVA
jgi:hypothetical protein